MTDKPILFSGPMVRALLEGRKTQTRRVLKDTETREPYVSDGMVLWDHLDGPVYCWENAPMVGDRLWVREACATWEGLARDVVYRADETEQGWSDLLHDARHGAPWKSRNSIFMPRWASRLTLIVTDVRVQRVQEISAEDAEAEGAPPYGKHLLTMRGMFNPNNRGNFRETFRELWDSLNAKRGYGWDENPWIVATTFTVHRCNIDQMEAAA